jgi:hypothetical protein
MRRRLFEFSVVGCAALLSCTSEAGTPPSQTDAPQILVPACAAPRPLLGTYDPRAPGYIVVYVTGTNVSLLTRQFAAKYGFEPKFVWEVALLGFASGLSPEAVAGLRCESAVDYIEYDGVVQAD